MNRDALIDTESFDGCADASDRRERLPGSIRQYGHVRNDLLQLGRVLNPHRLEHVALQNRQRQPNALRVFLAFLCGRYDFLGRVRFLGRRGLTNKNARERCDEIQMNRSNLRHFHREAS